MAEGNMATTVTAVQVQVIELRRRTLDLESRTHQQRSTSTSSSLLEEPSAERERERGGGGAETGDREWARDPKVHHAVKQALALARQLTKGWREDEDEDEVTSSEGDGDREVVESCRKRLEEISSHLRRLDLPSFCRPAASFGRAMEGEGAERSSLNPTTLPTSTSTRIPPAPSRSANNRAAGSGDRSREVQLHQQLHEDMSEEILHMARGLKQNALRQREKLDKTNAQLEEAENHLESNVASAKTRNKQAKVFYKRNWATSCAGYMLLLWVMLITAVILVVIRFSSFVGYTAVTTSVATDPTIERAAAGSGDFANAHQEL